MMNLVGNLIGPVTGLLDKVIEDKDQKAKLAHEIRWMATIHRLGLWICFCLSFCTATINSFWSYGGWC
mgnify:CR=1 FL=1